MQRESVQPDIMCTSNSDAVTLLVAQILELEQEIENVRLLSDAAVRRANETAQQQISALQ